MSLYILMLLLLIVVSLIPRRSDNRGLYKLTLFIMTVFLALRFGQGTDWSNYCYIYLGAPNTLDFTDAYYTSNNYDVEFSWKLMMNIGRLLDVKFVTISVLISLFEMMMVNKFISEYSDGQPLSLLLLYPTCYLTYFFSGFRQSIVIAVFLGYLVKMIEREKWLAYILSVIALSTIHQSALVLIPLPIFLRMREKLFIMVLISALFLGFLSPVWIPRLGFSTLTGHSAINSYSLAAIAYRTVSCVLILIMFINVRDKTSETDRLLLTIYLYGIVVYALFFRSSLVASRLAIVMTSVEVALIPNLLSTGNKRQQRLIQAILVVMVSVMTLKNINSYISQAGYHSNIKWYNYPYVTILYPEELYQVRDCRFDIYTYDSSIL